MGGQDAIPGDDGGAEKPEGDEVDAEGTGKRPGEDMSK